MTKSFVHSTNLTYHEKLEAASSVTVMPDQTLTSRKTILSILHCSKAMLSVKEMLSIELSVVDVYPALTTNITIATTLNRYRYKSSHNYF